MSRADLAHKLRLRFGTSHSEPTDQQLNRIVERLKSIKRLRVPSDADWNAAVTAECPSAGSYKYASQDNSDLNELLTDIINQAGGR